MNGLAKDIGQRVRHYRIEKRLSQEKLAELAGVHPTYIGQVERGEKNVTVESVSKMSRALGVPLSQLFEKLDEEETRGENLPLKCYELVAAQPPAEQQQLYLLLQEIIRYRRG